MSLRVLTTAGLVAGALLANLPTVAEPAESAAADALSEVVVTAQRREESAQNVGIAISVLSGASLADKSITYVNDLQNSIPSLQVEPAFGSGQPQYRIRGVGFLDYTSNNASPIGVSVDDVSLALPIQTRGSCSTSTALKSCAGRRVRCMAATPPAAKSISSVTAPPPIPMRASPRNMVRTMISPGKALSRAPWPRDSWAPVVRHRAGRRVAT
jgi:hypothetical protein